MEFVIGVLAIGALIGVIFTIASGGRKTEDVAAGAMGGAFYAGTCLLQLIIPAVVVLFGIWVLGKIFG